ncbi:putative ankyrin repeat protein [Trichoderma pleuroticola]
MADDGSEIQLNTGYVDKDPISHAKDLSIFPSSKTWSDWSSDSRSTERGSRLVSISLGSSGINFDVVTVHGIRDDYKTAWKREDGTRWIRDTLLKQIPIREVDYGYDVDEDARIYEPTENHQIIWICHDLGGTIVKEALCLALNNPRKYGDIAMLTRAIIFLGTPHQFLSIQDAEDQLHDLLLLSGPQIQTGLLSKIRNLALKVKNISERFLDTKLLNHATIFNIIIKNSHKSVEQQNESHDASTSERSEAYCTLNPVTPFSLYTHAVGHAFEAYGRYIANVTDAIGENGEPLWARLMSHRLYHVYRSVDITPKILQFQARMLSLAPPTIGLNTPFDQTDPVISWVTEQKQDYGVRVPRQSTIYFEFDQWDARYNNVSSMLIYVMSIITSHFWEKPQDMDVIKAANDLSEAHAWSLEDVYRVYRLLRAFYTATHKLTIFMSFFDQCPADQRRWFLERILEEERHDESEYRLIFSSSTRDGLNVEAFPDRARINIDDCPSMRSLEEEHAQDLLRGLETLLRRRPIYQDFRQSLEAVLEEYEYAPVIGHCILNWLGGLPRGKPKSEIANIIHNLSPATAENTVLVMVSSLGPERKSRAEKIFNWVKHAAEPWTLESLSEALVVDEFFDREPCLSDSDPQGLAAEIADSFGGIITIKNRDLRLDEDNDERVAQVNCSIAQRALEEFSSAIIYGGKDEEALIDTIVISRPRTSLVEYAVQFWPQHYKASANMKPRHLVHEFFANMESIGHWKTLFWLLSNPFIRPKRSYMSEMPFYAMLGLEDFVNEMLETRIGQPFFQIDCCAIVDKLLRHVSVDEEELKNALCWAAGQRNPDTIKSLVDKVPDLKAFEWPEDLFHRASSIGLDNLLTTILQSTCSNDVDDNAVLWNCVSSMEILLASDARPCLMRSDFGKASAVVLVVACGTPQMDDLNPDLIHLAIDNYKHKVLTLLIQSGIDFVSGEEDEAGRISVRPHLLFAATHGATECVRILLSYAVKPDILGTVSSALYEAVENGYTDIARRLLQYEPNQDLNVQSPDKAMLLTVAIETGDSELVSMLIHHGAEVNALDTYFVNVKTPLSRAFYGCHLEIAKLLVQNGADINHSDGVSFPPLIAALLHGDRESAEYILQDERVNVHQVGPNGLTALIAAVKYPTIVRALLSKGLPIDHDSILGTALSRATELNLPETVEALIKHNAKADLKCQHPEKKYFLGYTALQIACCFRHSKCVKLLLDAGANAYFRNSNGHNALDILLAGDQGSKQAEECFRLLLSHRNGNNVDENRQTQLHFIQRRTRVSIAELLLASSMDPIDTQDEDGYTPLAIAVRKENSSVARYLVGCGANVNIFGPEFGSILHMAVENGDLSLVKFLVDAGANREAVDPKYGKSLLYTAFDIEDDWGLERMVKYLVDEARVPINKFGGSLGYPIIRAVVLVGHHITNTIRMIKFLIRRKANINLTDSQGRTALHIACVSSPMECVSALVAAGANVNTRDKCGRLPIHFAAGMDSTEVVAYLLDQHKDVDINVEDQDGWTPLMWAARSGSVDIITMLVERGADVWARGRANGARGEWSALKLMNFSDNHTDLRHLLEPKERVRVTSEGIEEWDGHFHKIEPEDWTSYYCKSCFMPIIGRRWKCVDCSFSLCFKCFHHASYLHDPTHTFWAIEPLYRDEDAAAEAKNSDGEDVSSDGFDIDGYY